MVSFFVRKASTLACSRWEARVSFSSSPWSVWCCVSRSVTCCCSAARRDSASRARSSRPSASALRPWSSSLEDWPWQLAELQLQALAGRGHVGDAAAHLLQQLQLLLVRVVEGLARVLGPVQGLVGLRAEDHPHPLHDTAHGPRAPPSDRVTSGLAPAPLQTPQYGPWFHYRTVRAPDALLLQDDRGARSSGAGSRETGRPARCR